MKRSRVHTLNGSSIHVWDQLHSGILGVWEGLMKHSSGLSRDWLQHTSATLVSLNSNVSWLIFFMLTSCLQIRAHYWKLISYFSNKTYVVGTQKNRLNKTLLLSNPNTCLSWRIRKISFYVQKLCVSGPMWHFVNEPSELKTNYWLNQGNSEHKRNTKWISVNSRSHSGAGLSMNTNSIVLWSYYGS